METKKEINQLLQKLMDETITAAELNRFYTYIKRSKTDPEILKLLTEAWNHVQPTDDADADHSGEEGNGSLLQKKQRLFDALIKDNAKRYDEIVEIINKIMKGQDL